jgi:hypothetical protein
LHVLFKIILSCIELLEECGRSTTFEISAHAARVSLKTNIGEKHYVFCIFHRVRSFRYHKEMVLSLHVECERQDTRAAWALISKVVERPHSSSHSRQSTGSDFEIPKPKKLAKKHHQNKRPRNNRTHNQRLFGRHD